VRGELRELEGHALSAAIIRIQRTVPEYTGTVRASASTSIDSNWIGDAPPRN